MNWLLMQYTKNSLNLGEAEQSHDGGDGDGDSDGDNDNGDDQWCNMVIMVMMTSNNDDLYLSQYFALFPLTEAGVQSNNPFEGRSWQVVRNKEQAQKSYNFLRRLPKNTY